MSYDDYDDEDRYNPAEDEDVWASLEGATDWDDIETDHLIAIVRGLEKDKWPLQAHKLERAKEELAGRDKKWWQ